MPQAWSPSAMRERLRAQLSRLRRGLTLTPGLTERVLIDAIATDSGACRTPEAALDAGVGPAMAWTAEDHQKEGDVWEGRADALLLAAQKAERDKDDAAAQDAILRARLCMGNAERHHERARVVRGQSDGARQ